MTKKYKITIKSVKANGTTFQVGEKHYKMYTEGIRPDNETYESLIKGASILVKSLGGKLEEITLKL